MPQFHKRGLNLSAENSIQILSTSHSNDLSASGRPALLISMEASGNYWPLSALLHSAVLKQFCWRQTGPPGASDSELVPVVESTQKYLFNIPLPLESFQLSFPWLLMRKWFIIHSACCFCDTLVCRELIVTCSSSLHKQKGCIFSIRLEILSLYQLLFFNCVF